MLPISGFLAPPMKSVKAAVVSSVLSGNITELHIAPRKDFLSLGRSLSGSVLDSVWSSLLALF